MDPYDKSDDPGFVKRFKNHFMNSITGEVDQKDRQKIIDEFSDHDGGGILILNYQVGATGLNIQAADNVILYSPDWGPATEDQAIKGPIELAARTLLKFT